MAKRAAAAKLTSPQHWPKKSATSLMQPLRRLNLSEHTAQHLRDGFRSGRWSGSLPGVWRLSQELGLSRDAVRAALRLLEAEGLVTHGGAGRNRQVATPSSRDSRRSLRVGILLPAPLEKDNAHTHELILTARHAVEAAGHICFIAPKTNADFRHRPERIRRYLADCAADAWILYSARRTVLEVAATGEVPVFALGGPAKGLPVAGSRADLAAPIQNCIDLLVGHGHQSIVLIGPPSWRQPAPSASAQAFLERLQHHGIRTDPRFNLPDWEHTPEGLEALLRALFFATPPSALLIMEPECLGPVLVFLAARGLRVPAQVSVVNILPDPMQSFYRPAIAHFQWPIQPHLKRIIQWVNTIARGQTEHRMTTTEPVFVPAESIAPRARGA